MRVIKEQCNSKLQGHMNNRGNLGSYFRVKVVFSFIRLFNLYSKSS